MTISTFGQIDQWNTGAISAALAHCDDRARQCSAIDRHLDSLKPMAKWSGDSSRAADDAIGKARKDIDTHGHQVKVVREGLDNALHEVQMTKSAVAETRSFGAIRRISVVDRGSTTIAVPPSGPFTDEVEAAEIAAAVTATQRMISDTIEKANDADRDLATVFMAASGAIPLEQANRQANQSAAFRKVYGHDPRSTDEWRIAEFLDSNTTKSEFEGMPSNIVVGRIRPVPGQGVVRGSLFITGEKVFDPGTPGAGPRGVTSGYDYGNNRGFDSHFDPQNAKGAFVIDYERGVVIYRQNPTVDTSGNKTIGVPDVRVKQSADGSVRLDYQSPNPGSNLGPLNLPSVAGKDVHGTLVFTPGEEGPKASGTIGDYPSAEIYVDRPDGTTSTLLRDDQDSHSVLGPLQRLGQYHIVGEDQLPPETTRNELGYEPYREPTGPAGSVTPGGTAHVPKIALPQLAEDGTRLTPAS